MHRLMGLLNGGEGPAKALHCSEHVLDELTRQAPPPWALLYWMQSVLGITAVVHPGADDAYWELRTSGDETIARAFDGRIP
jgi:hypothetical protein